MGGWRYVLASVEMREVAVVVVVMVVGMVLLGVGVIFGEG